MICKKIGEDYFNGKASNVYMVCGIATRDAEDRPINGKPHASVNIALGQDEKGEQKYLALSAWRDRAGELMSVHKRDSVLAIGTMSTSTKGDKTYTNFDVSWFSVSGGSSSAFAPAPPEGVFVPVDDDDDGELPF